MSLWTFTCDIRGLRFVDDYYLYFATRSEAESALSDLHRIASHFATEINPLKTSIRELPEALQPAWKAEIQSRQIRANHQREDLLALFSSAFDNAARYPGSGVLKFAVKQSTAQPISSDNWPLYESFLLGSLVSEPGLAPVLATVLIKYAAGGYELNAEKLRGSLSEVARYHARFRQGFEVAWALWLSKLLSVPLFEEAIAEVSKLDDPIVALLALDLRNMGMADSVETTLWASRMKGEHLYTENWLLSYEACAQGWLGPSDGHDYIADDDFFDLLRSAGVCFYDSGTMEPASGSEWLEGY